MEMDCSLAKVRTWNTKKNPEMAVDTRNGVTRFIPTL